MVSWGNLADRLEQWSSSKYALFGQQLFFLLADRWSQTVDEERGEWPNILNDPYWAERISETEVLISDLSANDILIVDSENKEIKWEYGGFLETSPLNIPRGLDYDSENDHILCADEGNSRIVEIDRPSKTIVNSLDTIDSGNLDRPFSARWNPTNNHVILVDNGNHYVAQVDWTGAEDWSVGTFGTQGLGQDQANLSRPRYADINKGMYGHTNRFTIADRDNDRGLRYDAGTDSIKSQFLIPQCTHFRIDKANNRSLGSRVQGGVWGFQGLVRAFPRATWQFMPWKNRLMVVSWYGVFEINMRTVAQTPQFFDPNTPMKIPMFSDHDTGGSETRKRVVDANGYNELTVYGISDASATLRIYKGGMGDWPEYNKTGYPADWALYDSVSMTANELESYVVANPTGIYGATIDAGVIDLWAEVN